MIYTYPDLPGPSRPSSFRGIWTESETTRYDRSGLGRFKGLLPMGFGGGFVLGPGARADILFMRSLFQIIVICFYFRIIDLR